MGKKDVIVRLCTTAFIVCVQFLLSGCQQPVTKEPVIKPVFYPPAPEKARLQFLKSFSRPEDVGVAGPSAFERFVIGEPEVTESIKRPYGMAIFNSKLYICDTGRRLVEVIDLVNKTFGYLTNDRRLINPVNIYIESSGMKYVTDPTAGALFVFDENDNLDAILGRGSEFAPLDVVVSGQYCYITDFKSNKIVVLDKKSGKEVKRIGKGNPQSGTFPPAEELPPGQFMLISDLAIDQQGSIYITDKSAGKITEFDKSGIFKRTIGRRGDNIDEFLRPKGIAIDRENRIWVVDTAPEVVKVYNSEAQLLLYFGFPGNKPGMMNLPAKVILDYDNVDLFRKYAVEGASLEFLVIVSNQYGLNKINVYGFGEFPEQEQSKTDFSEEKLQSAK